MEHKEKTQKPYPPEDVACIIGFVLVFIGIVWCLGYCCFSSKSEKKVEEIISVPNITIAFMNFTMFKTAETRFGAKWNLSIRVPKNLPGFFTCLHGDVQASLLYKNIHILTSPAISYKNLKPGWSQLLKVSGVVPEEDINGAIGKSIMDDIKERNEVWFGSRLFLPDCRENTIGMMKYVCDEAKLRYDSRSQEITTSVFGNPTCRYVGH